MKGWEPIGWWHVERWKGSPKGRERKRLMERGSTWRLLIGGWECETRRSRLSERLVCCVGGYVGLACLWTRTRMLPSRRVATARRGWWPSLGNSLRRFAAKEFSDSEVIKLLLINYSGTLFFEINYSGTLLAVVVMITCNEWVWCWRTMELNLKCGFRYRCGLWAAVS